MLFRVARYYLRSEWIKLGVIIFAVALGAFFAVNNTRTMPMTYEAFEAQYGDTLTMDRLAKRVNIPREQLGDSLKDAYPVIHEQHFTGFLVKISDVVIIFAPVFAGVLAVLFLCGAFRRHRLGPLLAAGCSRGAVYLFLTVLYYGLFLLSWLIFVPFSLGRYHIPLTAGQYSCLRLLGPTLLNAFMFSAAAAFFFAFLLRRPLPALLAGVGLLFLLQWLSGLVPLPVGFTVSLLEWKPDTDTGPFVAQSCVTAAAAAASVVGGWLCFRRQEQT